MKTIIFVFACVIFLSGQSQSAKQEEILLSAKSNKECMDATKIRADRIKKLAANDIYVTDRTDKDSSYVTCILKKNGLINAKGFLDITKFMRGLSTKMQEAINSFHRICSSVASRSSVIKKNEKAAYIAMCIAGKVKENQKNLIIFTAEGI